MSGMASRPGSAFVKTYHGAGEKQGILIPQPSGEEMEPSKDRQRVLLMIFGALIVFAAFFLKEHFHDRVKGEEEELNQALQRQVVLKAIQSVHGATLKAPWDIPNAVAKSRFYFNSKQFYIEQLDEQKQALRGVEDLLRALPEDDSEGRKVIQDASHAAWTKLIAGDEAASAMQKLLDDKTSQGDARIASDDAALRKLQRAKEIATDYVSIASDKAKEKAQAAKEKGAKSLQVITYAEYGCFVVGWLLGTYGKLKGIDAGGAAG